MAHFWTAFEWGAYLKKTSKLTLAEHGAYLLLMAEYYQTSAPLPANAELLLRVCRAFADDEKAAVVSVLAQFFTLEADGYHHARIDEELVKRSQISEKRRDAGKKGAGVTNGKCRGKQVGKPTASADTVTVTVTKDNPPTPFTAFNPTDLSVMVKGECGIAGDKILWTIREVIEGVQKRSKLTGQQIADKLIADIREFQQGPKSTFGVAWFLREYAAQWHDPSAEPKVRYESQAEIDARMEAALIRSRELRAAKKAGKA